MEASCIAFHTNGDIVVAYGQQPHLLDSDGNHKRSLNIPDTAKKWTHFITSVSISPQGHVYIAECHSYLIRVFSESGAYLHNFSTLRKGDPSTPANPIGTIIDREGNLLVIDRIHGITIHTCPSGEIIGHIQYKVYARYVRIGCAVNSKNQILLHYTPKDTKYSRVVAIDYSGNELYSFTPKIDQDVSKDCVYGCGIVCDSNDNVIIVSRVFPTSHTGHIHMYSPTGTFIKCIAKGLYFPRNLSITQDGSSIAVANENSVLIYSPE